MEISDTLIEKIKSLAPATLIAISGFGGSGKSTFAESLGKSAGIPAVGIDSFARNRLEEGNLWESIDFGRLEQEILIPFSQGEKVLRYGHYDWGANTVVETREVNHDGYLLLEGVGLFRPELNKYFAYKIWVDCPLEEAIRRGKQRDRDIYQNPQDEKWDGVWKRNDNEYFTTFKPQELADLVIDNCSVR